MTELDDLPDGSPFADRSELAEYWRHTAGVDLAAIAAQAETEADFGLVAVRFGHLGGSALIYPRLALLPWPLSISRNAAASRSRGQEALAAFLPSLARAGSEVMAEVDLPPGISDRDLPKGEGPSQPFRLAPVPTLQPVRRPPPAATP